MMKKLAKLTALLAAAALLFGAVGCSDDDGGDGDGFPSKHETVDVKEIEASVTSVSSDVVFDPAGIATATVDGTNITITSLKAGTTTMTIKVSGEGYTDTEVEISITVAEDGAITYELIEDGEGDGGNTDTDGNTGTGSGDNEDENPDDAPVLTGIEIKIGDDAQDTYTVGEELNTKGITVTAKYSDDTINLIDLDEANFKATYNGVVFTTEKEGTFDVTLSAEYEGKTASVTCTITVKQASSNESAYILYFDSSTEIEGGQSGTAEGATESSVVTLGDAVLTWGSVSGSNETAIPITGANGPKVDTGTAAGTDYKATSYSSDSVTFTTKDVKTGDIIATLKFTVTPSKKISLKNFEGVAGNTQTGNMNWSVKIGDNTYDFTNNNDNDKGKYVTIDKALSGDMAAAFDVEITAKASKNEAFSRSNNAMKVWFGDLKLTFAEAE